MKFVFALALVGLYVALMGARPNIDVHQRAVRDLGEGGGVSLGYMNYIKLLVCN